jgi:hypothetical protein
MQESNSKMVNERADGKAKGVREYEAPGIDAVMTPEELEREVLYAGDSSIEVLPPSL